MSTGAYLLFRHENGIDMANLSRPSQMVRTTVWRYWRERVNRLKRKDNWVPGSQLTSSWPCKNPDPIISTLTGFICWQDSLPLISGSGVWCLQVPASYKRHILMGLPLLCLIAAPPTPSTTSPILTSATTPTLSLCAGPWLTLSIQGSGLGQQTPSQMDGCPEELMEERRKRLRDPCDVPETFQRATDCGVFTKSLI